MIIFNDGKHIIECDSEATAIYMCGTGFINYYMGEIYKNKLLIDSNTSAYFDGEDVKQYINKIHQSNSEAYYKVKAKSHGYLIEKKTAITKFNRPLEYLKYSKENIDA